MIEQNTAPETSPPVTNLHESSPPAINSTQAKKQNWMPSILNTQKGRLLIFAGLFGIVGATAFIVSFAATATERDLITGFRNMAKNRPTVVSGSANLTYKDSPNLRNAQLRYQTIFDSGTGNSSGNGELSINNTKFSYDYATVNKDHYFKLGNTSAVKNVVKPSSQIHPYLSSRFSTLKDVDNQWLVQKQQTSPGAQSSTRTYDCVLSTHSYMSALDAQRLQSFLLKNSPLKVKDVKSTIIDGETVSQTILVMRSVKSADSFATQIQDLDFVRKINSCVQQTTNANAVNKLRDALKSNNVSISVFMNDAKIIKKITFDTNSKKSIFSFTANFAYTQQPPIIAPADAKPADEFIRKMTSNPITSTSDRAKEKDLYTINVEVEKYIKTNNHLPATLRELNISGLNNALTNYEYKYTSRFYNGGTTLTYSTCATFQYEGAGVYSSNSFALEPATFTVHKSGKGCYINSYYKSTSHLSVPN